jgi:hypothetical protein
MDIDGMDVSIVYPTTGVMFYGGPESELLASIRKIYNSKTLATIYLLIPLMQMF